MPPQPKRSRPSVRPNFSVGAFFDVDNTLVPGKAIEVRFFRHLWKHGLVGIHEVFSSLQVLLRHVPPVSVHPLREHKVYLADKQPSVIEPVAEEFVQSEICPRLSQDALAALEQHREAQHHVVLVSASLDFLIAPIARFLRVETVLAAQPEREADRYTGKLLSPFPYGAGKRQVTEVLSCKHSLDLKASYAYGDSPGDREMLEVVGNPFVVNPIRGMARIARREGWRIVRWK